MFIVLQIFFASLAVLKISGEYTCIHCTRVYSTRGCTGNTFDPTSNLPIIRHAYVALTVFEVLVTVFSMACHKMVMQRSRVVYHRISTSYFALVCSQRKY